MRSPRLKMPGLSHPNAELLKRVRWPGTTSGTAPSFVCSGTLPTSRQSRAPSGREYRRVRSRPKDPGSSPARISGRNPARRAAGRLESCRNQLRRRQWPFRHTFAPDRSRDKARLRIDDVFVCIEGHILPMMLVISTSCRRANDDSSIEADWNVSAASREVASADRPPQLHVVVRALLAGGDDQQQQVTCRRRDSQETMRPITSLCREADRRTPDGPGKERTRPSARYPQRPS